MSTRRRYALKQAAYTAPLSRPRFLKTLHIMAPQGPRDYAQRNKLRTSALSSITTAWQTGGDWCWCYGLYQALAGHEEPHGADREMRDGYTDGVALLPTGMPVALEWPMGSEDEASLSALARPWEPSAFN